MPISKYLKNLRNKVGSEIIQVPSVAAIIRDQMGRILLVKDSSLGMWSIPAGAVDLGESPHDAIVREVEEETNLEVTPTNLRAVLGGMEYRFEYKNGDRVEYHISVFDCEILGKTNTKNRDGEVAEMRFFSPPDMPKLALPYPPELFD